MLRKQKVDPTKSGFWAGTRRMACLSILAVAFAGSAYAQNGQGGNGQGGNNNNQGGTGHKAPEIATGAAITATLLAGGGLLLLADRRRRKTRSS
jgi:hypothetical protein